MAYEVREPDRALSPKTGMTRRHWIDAGAFLLEGVFRHVKHFDDPVALPKQPGKSYPQPDDPPWRFRSAEFEGLSRTFMLAAPILAEEPDLEVGGWNLRDYYANQILRATDPASPRFVGTITEMKAKYKFPLYQHTAEGAALALGLRNSKAVLWDRYSKDERDQVARLLDDFTHHRTNSHNWRWFNVLMSTFLELEGYDVCRTTRADHLQNLLAFYAGDGWYRDMGTFDFYSAWAFQYYGPIWAAWYGHEHAPEIAAIIERRHNRLMETYPLMFARDGASLMWGRSIIYRCAASAPFPAAFMLREPNVDPGWARRIASGNILQFLTRDDVFTDGVPSLGFYRTFDPLVQSYSCAVSPFWLAKVWLALALPADSPFWTATENEGVWEDLGDASRTETIEGPGLGITVHGASGCAEVAPGKVASKNSNPNYTRLAYNTALLWENDTPDGASAMAYAVRDIGADTEFWPQTNLKFCGARGGVLYRQTQLRGWLARVDLADIPVPAGVLRVDRVRVPYAHELRLGHFALPHPDGVEPVVEVLDIGGRPAAMAAVPGRQLALVALAGWENVGWDVRRDLHPETPESTLLYARTARETDYSGMYLAVTLLLHRTDDTPWPEKALRPVARLDPVAWTASGQPMGCLVELTDGRALTVDFEDIEGRARQ